MAEDIFEEAKRRQQELFERLNNCDIAEILGLVDASGASGSKSQGEKLWTLLFTFDAWKYKNRCIQDQNLTIRKQVADDELKKIRDSIAPYDIIHIRARIAIDNTFSNPQGLLIEIVEPDITDQELASHAEALQQPVTIEDSFFGKFCLNRSVNWYEGEVVWQSERISLQLSMDDCDDEQKLLAHTRILWNSQGHWNKIIADYAVNKLLPLKNEAWLDEDEKEVTSDQFKKRLVLEAITVYPDGSFKFWHDDGDLFGGHSILISGNLTDGPLDADIPG